MIRLAFLVVFTIASLPLGAGSAMAACAGRVLEGEHFFRAPLCVPKEPKRILVLDPTFSLGMSLELGLPVVAAPLFAMSDKELRAKAESASIVDIGSYNEPSVEKIVAAQPDLIIGVEIAAPFYEQLSQIAPTVLIGSNDWRAHFEALAVATGRSDAVNDLFAAYDRRVADIRARMPDVRVSVVRITPWDFQVYTQGPNAYGPFAVMSDAGVRRTDYETVEDATMPKRPDWEELAALDGDILLYIVGGANKSDVSGRHEEVIENPLWKMLPAVKANRVHRVDAGIWMEFSGLGSAHRVLDDVERYILSAR